MIAIKKATEVPKDIIYKTFMEGFSDYMVKIKMDETNFWHHFFEVEGNELELSHIAYIDNKPAGIVLGGNKIDEHHKTLRCGGMSVIPEARKRGLATALMASHRKLAIEKGYKQLFLEVIVNNHKATKLYNKLGYESAYRLDYWQLDQEGIEDFLSKNNKVDGQEPSPYDIREVDLDVVIEAGKKRSVHLPWQASYPYMKSVQAKSYGLYVDDTLAGVMVANGRKVMHLYIEPCYRGFDYGRILLSDYIRKKQLEGLSFFHSNNHELMTYMKKIGMKPIELSQFEMYQWL